MEVELYVAVLGASNYTYVEATRTQQLADFVGATMRALEFFGVVPQIIMPDQLRSAVSRPCLYEPEINATFAEMGKHYGCAIVPARPRKPRDKAKVEVGVQIAQRWILACLRNRIFFSLDELNVAIAELLERLNARPLSKTCERRLALFETIDRPCMKPLPASRYERGRSGGSMSEYRPTTGELRPSICTACRVRSSASASTCAPPPPRSRSFTRTNEWLRTSAPMAAKQIRSSAGAPTALASGVWRLAAGAHRQLGEDVRPARRRTHRSHVRSGQAPGVALSLGLGRDSPGQELRQRTADAACSAPSRSVLRAIRASDDPQARTRS